jgi:N-acetylmuramoyl-L-alanine amidase
LFNFGEVLYAQELREQRTIKKMKLLFYYFLLLSTLSLSQEKDSQSKIKYYTEKAQNYLDKEKVLNGYYSIGEEGIKIFENALAKKNNTVEFLVEWKDFDNFKATSKLFQNEQMFEKFKNGKYVPDIENLKTIAEKNGNSTLKDLRIAIDPGHLANDPEMGNLEMKQIRFRKDTLRGLKDSIEVTEGVLTYAAAQLLKQKLETQGAIVLITRTNGNSAFGKTFYQWKKEDLKNAVDSLYKIGEIKPDQKNYFLSPKAKDRDIFRVLFKDLELAKRAELINNFKPDFTIIIHFNVDELNVGWEKPGIKDFNMTFVGGAFMKNDLISKEKRFEFLRLLISDDLEKSIILSSSMVKSFEKVLMVKTAGIHEARYLTEGCLPTGEPGVYCRNLQLTRYVHSPLVYGETLYQDNLNEALLLSQEKDKTKNERVKQVADAYYLGILNYISATK